MGVEPLLNGSSFSPRGLTETCRVLRSQGSVGRRSLSAHPGLGVVGEGRRAALPFRTKEGWLFLVLPGTEVGG